MQPILDPGIARVASYSQFDDFRDNGWCQLGANNGTQGKMLLRRLRCHLRQFSLRPSNSEPHPNSRVSRPCRIPLTFLVSESSTTRSCTLTIPKSLKLSRSQSAPLTTIARHSDPKVPYDQRPKFSATGKAAFELLHQRYPKSPWSAKTPYYY